MAKMRNKVSFHGKWSYFLSLTMDSITLSVVVLLLATHGFWHCFLYLSVSNYNFLHFSNVFLYFRAELIKIYTGSIEIANAPGKMSYTTKFIIHEDFNNQTFHNNIGLVNLDTALVLDGNCYFRTVGFKINVTLSVLESRTWVKQLSFTRCWSGHNNLMVVSYRVLLLFYLQDLIN